ncbi:histidine kinase [Desulfofarcimen acetoxidans DSM 771]|uniref:histidine kinase n=1 Tax=Desulfofarcimen acetoxidans (strain ATCC 49208 / DSM 771 / KCTC 5769 / VKM B-1644 / 5575) TaxID=485916 RepID=C8W235_DESAS|nr:ATP-binding protein [Desulfofarcimen acetoxidans]ACV61699.1 histidine kinase [Desulfofarcimen acetoxidans DSM 771]
MINLKFQQYFSFFHEKSLTNQIIIITAAIMLIPLAALIYDISFASRTDKVVFLDKEKRLESLVNSAKEEYIKNLVNTESDTQALAQTVLHKTFVNVIQPYVPANTGIRFGLYVPDSNKITVLGFLHNYRNLSPEEETIREKDIFKKTKSGLVATQMSKEPLFRITGTWDDQVVEYICPVIVQNKLIAVMWAGERLNPIFYQNSYFRKLVRYFIIFVLALGIAGTLFIVRNITTGVNRLKRGLQDMEKDIHLLLPEMSGELGQVAAAINKMAVALSEKERLENQLRQSEHLIALGRLATGVAHELRNPAGIIKTLAELMHNEYSLVTGIEEFTRSIEEQVDRQNTVIQELLDFGRPSKCAFKKCSVNDLLTGVLSFSSAMLRKQNITVHLAFQESIPLIWVDTEKLKQVFVNLIVNAAEAMPDGGMMEITTTCKDKFLSIQFKDSGEGISPELKTLIFDPFYTTKATGTGLGLPICYQNLNMHGGTIKVDSIRGQGAIFTIILPVEQNHFKGGGQVDTSYIGN